MKRIDLTGRKFGRWTVLADTTPERRPKGFLKRRYQGVTQWRCQCECGKIKEHVLYTSLTSGCSQSCGCLRSELHRKPDDKVHSQRNPLYAIWQGMKTRCYNEKHATYRHYGGRGIGICGRWLESFENFAEDMGPRPTPDHSIERKDNMGDYTPENCCWHTDVGQGNNRRSNYAIPWKGQTLTLVQLCRMENVDYPSMRNMISGGGSVEEAVGILQDQKHTFFERAAELGCTNRNRSGKTRVRKPKPAFP